MNRRYVNQDVRNINEPFGVPDPDELQTLTGIDLRPVEQIRTANAILGRAEVLRRRLRELVNTDPHGSLTEQALSYAHGQTELDTLTIAALDLPSDLANPDTLAHRALVDAADQMEREARRLVKTITETEWLRALRPVIHQLVNAAVADAHIVEGYLEQTYRGDSRRPGFNAWGPTPDVLETNIECRQAWERLDHTLVQLNEVHGYADGLRRSGLLPVIYGRDTSEDYRWLQVSRLNGRPEQQREFFIANHQVAEPGIYFADQMLDTEDPSVEPEPEYGPSPFDSSTTSGIPERVIPRASEL